MSGLHSKLSFKRKMIMKRRMVVRGMVNMVRNMWLTMAACLVMSITLFTVFVSLAATLALNGTVEAVRKEKADLSIFLKSETESSIVDSLKYELEGDSEVDSVMITTVEEQNDKFQDWADEETLQAIKDTGLDLKATLPIQLSIRVHDPDKIESVTGVVTDDFYMAYMDTNSYERQFYNGDNTKIIETINAWAFYAQIGGAVLSGIFLLISVLVIFNTIRMAIFSRREEIEMEKLIGAEEKYIRGPFLVEAEMYGVLAAGVALLLGYLTLWRTLPILREAGVSVGILEDVAFGQWYLVVLVAILVGVTIGELSARLAVRRYLRV